MAIKYTVYETSPVPDDRRRSASRKNSEIDNKIWKIQLKFKHYQRMLSEVVLPTSEKISSSQNQKHPACYHNSNIMKKHC